MLFSSEEIAQKLQDLEGWEVSEASIQKEYILGNFVEAVKVITHISIFAEEMDHHPDIYLTQYRKLKVVLSTHSEGGITQKDFELAKKIEDLPKVLKV